MTDQTHTSDRFSSQYTDLLDERLGGRALNCSDQWFAECANLVKPGRGVFKEGYFVDTGQWMDGWESQSSASVHFGPALASAMPCSLLARLSSGSSP